MTMGNGPQAAKDAATSAVANQKEAVRAAETAKGSLWYEDKPDTPSPASDVTAIAAASAAVAASAPVGAQPAVPNLAGQATVPILAGVTPRTSVPSLQQGDSRMREGTGASPTGAAVAPMPNVQSTMASAENSKLDIADFNTSTTTTKQPTIPSIPPSGGGAGQLSGAIPQTPQDDQNKQERKDRFVSDAKLLDTEYNQAIKTKQRTPYELKAGSVIPAAMISGLNSDLPGQIIAQVRETVWDSRSGRYILIPQGAKLIGMYDAHVAYGQERALVVWSRIIFPDGSSYNLRGMPGADQAGYAGFYDTVDNHYVKVFGSALAIAVLGAGIQLTQPSNGNSANQTPSVSQTLGASLGQQLGQTGMTITQKNLNIQPTLKVAPGYRFNVMITADCILEPLNQ
ncbi:conjugal transfer protein TrbI [Pandoraea cepalis]|uniref:Conjugal transfer protein TrbI n=2 Tax=Pandoraea cepalis TaxID=2508294 RepID=A0AAW7MH21_9BURK|nr:conjugal transfer protein TrbI [Pandoraea cepalis]MDN4578888.1 conjugal transfer protein TrbI [Pandoraea cepalis]